MNKLCLLLAASLASAPVTEAFAPTLSSNRRFGGITDIQHRRGKNDGHHHAGLVSQVGMSSPFDGLAKMFSNEKNKKSVAEVKPALPNVTIDPDYKLAAIFLTAGILLDTIPYIQLTLGPLVTLLGGLFLFQTFRLRFEFDSDSFELKSALKDSENLGTTGENIVVGGTNRWAYDSFVNWDFFPEGWIDQPQGPILVYFKETQTPQEKWSEGPGESANSPEAIAKGAKPGQVHFFPAICNAKQIREEFKRRECAKIAD
jgi:hypothetical protein